MFLNVKLSQLDLILTVKFGTTSVSLQSLKGKVYMMDEFKGLTFNGFGTEQVI